MVKYQHFDPLRMAELARHYLTGMVDEKNGYLPYWLILPNQKPAEAAHCRVDDAELVGSWYEGLDSAMQVLGTDEGKEVLAGFEAFLRSSWGPMGLRYHAPYPWTHTMHASFHEMGYILPALNRILRKNPGDREMADRISGLVHGMRSLVIERKVRTFWSGDSPEEKPIYEFPNDVYLLDGGFDLTRHTGRGEQPIRNGVVIPALMNRAMEWGDEAALDLARGLANQLLGPSRYFSWQYAFFGHVHSAVWVASGLADLTDATGDPVYLTAARGIYDYVRSLSSSFGWVPEYAQWHPMREEHCETCCIKDMLVLAEKLTRRGYPGYWQDIVLFSRNQLAENQITSASYVVTDNSRPDTESTTWRDIDKRMIGGFTGGSLPNSISLSKFRSIAGCCAGTAPIAIQLVWDRAVDEEENRTVVNIPLDRDTDAWRLQSDYPDRGEMRLTLKKGGRAAFRRYSFMGERVECTVNSRPVSFREEDGLILPPPLAPGDTVALRHPLRTVRRKEMAAGQEYTVFWRGPDVVDITPRGEHLRLYQRDLRRGKVLPRPEDVPYTGAANYGPTQQKR